MCFVASVLCGKGCVYGLVAHQSIEAGGFVVYFANISAANRTGGASPERESCKRGRLEVTSVIDCPCEVTTTVDPSDI